MSLLKINIDNVQPMIVSNDILKMRSNMVDILSSLNHTKSNVSIIVTAYNRIQKTKECVESILKYTKNVDYDLILVDNGSDEDVLEYFESVNYEKKQIIHISQNINFNLPYHVINIASLAKYVAVITNDIVVTENWLSNLIKVADSDEKIGMVVPMSSNVSNLQCFNMDFCDYNDMQEKAKAFNVSDPVKWHERMRLITLGAFFRKECLMTIGWPCFDCGFVHDFGDDDLSFRVRRSGYKLVLAGDTWIHHNHNIFKLEDKEPDEFQKSIETGRNNFKEKYFGIDAWDDVNNFVFPHIGGHVSEPGDKDNVSILGVDVKCGTPILDIKNIIRKYEVFDSDTYAFTTESKYDIDLRTICGDKVVCDRLEYLYNSFVPNSFDYVIIGNDINNYSYPEKVVHDVYGLLKQNGEIFISFKNTYNVFTLLSLLGYNLSYYEMAHHCSVETFFMNIQNIGADIEIINQEYLQAEKNISEFIFNMVKQYKSDDINETLLYNKLMTNKYWIKITKK